MGFRAGKSVAFVLLTLLILLHPSPSSGQGTVQLKFVQWTYGQEMIRGFLDEFEKANPGVKVEIIQIPTQQYAAKVVLMVGSRTPFDVLWVRDNDLATWGEWLMPLDGVAGVKNLASGLLPIASRSMVRSGKLYGLPYYTGTMHLLYNEKMLKQAGFASPPATWDELVRQAEQIKAKGLSRYPIVWWIAEQGPMGVHTFAALLASRGARLFESGSFTVTKEARETLRWWADTFHKSKISEPKSVEFTYQTAGRAWMSGEYAFTIQQTAVGGPGWAKHPTRSKVADSSRFAMFPGNGKSAGWWRMYAVNRGTANAEAAGRLAAFLGGKETAKKWAIEEGLLWGYRGIEFDPRVTLAAATWGDQVVIKKQLNETLHMSDVIWPFFEPWFSEWMKDANATLQSLLSGALDPDRAASALSQKAAELSRRR